MKKKHYIMLLFIGTLCIFSILPVLNYVIDQRRVLHHDYMYSYEGISINKPFLKVLYLLDNKKKYDTILMGSSRNASLDVNLVSDHAYNMYYEFGVVGAHLHNLKILLENNVKIKSLWLGINDFDIWKDPQDHELDYSKKIYKNDLMGKFDFYSFYLLKKIDKYDIDILIGNNHLNKSNRIIQKKDAIYEKKLKEKNQKILNNPQKWINKMTSMAGTILGYQDNEYRINQVVKEIDEIKKLCDKNNISLNVFTYPSFYKTYLLYNQYKIEEFKRKLAAVLNFYDFYMLKDIGLNELNWRDSSHFTNKIGTDLIKTIQNNKCIVTQTNIDAHIKETRGYIKNILNKVIPIKYILKFNAHIDLNSLKVIFDIKNKQFSYEKNKQFQLDKKQDYVEMKVTNSDPSFIVTKVKAKSKNIILSYKVQSEQKTIFQLYYKKENFSQYNEKNSYRIHLKKGLNQFNLLIPSEYINNGLRVDFASTMGIYQIEKLALYDVE